MNWVEIQTVCTTHNLPEAYQIQAWIDAALDNHLRDTEIVLRIVDIPESAELNQRYRHKSGPTNILSFPADLPAEVDVNWLGDLVVCAPVLTQEATEQNKPIINHWAHIIIHGVLHLLGHDHLEETQAEAMEALEIKLLERFNIPNPYQS